MPASRVEPGQPIAEINTTPLIDVMLVLLVMIVITIPVATNAITIDLPRADPPRGTVLRPVANRLVVTAGDGIEWNGTRVSEAQLASLLVDSTRLDPEPELQYAPAPQARDALAARVLRDIKAAGVTRMAFVGNERFARFDR